MFIVINIIGTNERGGNAEITGLILHRIVRIHEEKSRAIVRDFNSNKEKWRLLQFREDECLGHSLGETKRKEEGKKGSRLDSYLMLQLRFKCTILSNPWPTCQNDYTFAGVTLACSCPEVRTDDWVTLSFSLPLACASKVFIRPEHPVLTEPELNASVSLWHTVSNHYLSDNLCHMLNQKLTSTTTICNKEFI